MKTGGEYLGRYTPPWVGTPPVFGQVPPLAGKLLPPGRYPPESSACWEIRATGGRYASYWNAFLLVKNSMLFLKPAKETVNHLKYAHVLPRPRFFNLLSGQCSKTSVFICSMTRDTVFSLNVKCGHWGTIYSQTNNLYDVFDRQLPQCIKVQGTWREKSECLVC